MIGSGHRDLLLRYFAKRLTLSSSRSLLAGIYPLFRMTAKTSLANERALRLSGAISFDFYLRSGRFLAGAFALLP
jgi:hypothetical protein